MTTSPEATGQAGAFFEQHVDAAFLAFLLVRGTPPFLLRSELVEVHLQSGHLGWETDDLLAVGLGKDGLRRNAALQVKRTLSIARSNKDCVDVFGKAWSDFQSNRFQRDRDALGLIIGPSSHRTQQGLRVLLSTARIAIDATDAFRRLSLPNYRDKVALDYASIIRAIVDERNGAPTTDDEFRAFLRHFDFVCLDLHTSTSSTEALILSLLGACAGPDAEPDAATGTWNELLQIVGRGMPDGASYTKNTLPEALKSKFRSAASLAFSAFENLQDTTQTIRVGVDSEVSGYHIRRTALEQRVIETLAAGRVLVVAGHAGSGKSAIAKAVFDNCSSSRFSLAMRAGMLGRTHLAETLFSQGLTIRRLREVSALDGEKVLWIESGERLLEKPASERQAFNDLLRLVRDDPGWRILVTCRTYSAETFRSAFLESSGIPSTLLEVPPLTDDELDELAEARPALRRPLGHPQLRSLLRNPFFLSKAALMNWEDGRQLPLSKRSFRRMVWREIIRRDDETSDGMPQRRADCYMELAKRRARALASYVDADDLDDAALQKLKLDSLARESTGRNNFWAPGHDVLEDWALLEWLDREHAQTEGAWPDFFNSIGTHPATRRAFRIWLSERVDDEGSIRLDLPSLLRDVSLPAHWKDDALVAILSGAAPGDFLSDNSKLFLADGAALLLRALHIARVACKKVPSEASGTMNSIAFVPVGPAWGALADFAEQNVNVLPSAASPLLAGFAEDWARGVTSNVKYPAGARAVGRIVSILLRDRDLSRSYDSEPTERLLRVLLKIPNEAKTEIAALADECSSMDQLDCGHLFLRQLFSHLYTGPLCRDCPEVVIRVLRRLVQPDKEPEPREGGWSYSRSRIDQEQAFGMPESLHGVGFPASAYQGPFLHLLRCHPGAGLGFVIEFVNQATAAYLSPEQSEWHRPMGEIHVRLPDGSGEVHRGDGRLWSMYRVNCGPELLRSALMALEKFLLELGEQYPQLLPTALQRLMEEARSVALTSVAASVAMAHPAISGEQVLPILQCRIVFDWDHGRYVADQTNSDRIFENAFPATTTEAWVYNRERSEAAEQPHRQENLTLLMLKLQQTDLRERVWEVIDHHKEALPPPSAQSQEDKLWRLQLHRMDLRTFEAVDRNSDSGVVTFQPSTPPEDVREVVEATRPWLEATERAAGLRMWATSCYERKNEQRYPPSAWREKLAAARTQHAGRAGWRIDSRLLVAVVCCRDSFELMNAEEREWCIETIAGAFTSVDGGLMPQRSDGRGRSAG